MAQSINYKYNVSDVMNNWLIQEGYPVVNVTREISESNKTIVYNLKQKYFLLSQTKNDSKE
jgi:hypothetical protein